LRLRDHWLVRGAVSAHAVVSSTTSAIHSGVDRTGNAVERAWMYLREQWEYVKTIINVPMAVGATLVGLLALCALAWHYTKKPKFSMESKKYEVPYKLSLLRSCVLSVTAIVGVVKYFDVFVEMFRDITTVSEAVAWLSGSALESIEVKAAKAAAPAGAHLAGDRSGLGKGKEPFVKGGMLSDERPSLIERLESLPEVDVQSNPAQRVWNFLWSRKGLLLFIVLLIAAIAIQCVIDRIGKKAVKYNKDEELLAEKLKRKTAKKEAKKKRREVRVPAGVPDSGDNMNRVDAAAEQAERKAGIVDVRADASFGRATRAERRQEQTDAENALMGVHESKPAPAQKPKGVPGKPGEGKSKKAVKRRAAKAKKAQESKAEVKAEAKEAPKPEVKADMKADPKGKGKVEQKDVNGSVKPVLEAKTSQPRFIAPSSIFRMKTDRQEFGGYCINERIVTCAHCVYTDAGVAEKATFVWRGKTHVIPAESWETFVGVDVATAKVPKGVVGLQSLRQASHEAVVSAVEKKEHVAVLIDGGGRPITAAGQITGREKSMVQYTCSTRFGDSGFPAMLENGDVIGPHTGGDETLRVNYCTYVQSDSLKC